MRHIILLPAILLCLWSTVLSNPKIDPYHEAGISEVHIVNSADWYIELDGNWFLYDINKQSGAPVYPCTVKVYLSIKSRNSSYGVLSARVPFGANKFGVISRKTLIASPRNPPNTISLEIADSVKVALDSVQLTQSASSDSRVQYWAIQISSFPAGNSLFVYRDRHYRIVTYPTKRMSIGFPNNYSTKYKFSVSDKYGKPLENIKGSTNWPSTTYTDAAGICNISASLIDTGIVAVISDARTAHEDEIKISSMPISYIDKDTVVNKTITLPVTHYEMIIASPDSLKLIRCYKLRGATVFSEIDFRDYFRKNTYEWRVHPSVPVCSLCFALGYPGNNSCLSTWSGKYIDTSNIIKKEVLVDITGITNTPASVMTKSKVSILPVVRNNREISIIISSSVSLKNASVSLCTFDGKEIEAQPVYINNSGTNTTLLQLANGKKFPPGKYLCILRMDNYSPVTCTVTIP